MHFGECSGTKRFVLTCLKEFQCIYSMQVIVSTLINLIKIKTSSHRLGKYLTSLMTVLADFKFL